MRDPATPNPGKGALGKAYSAHPTNSRDAGAWTERRAYELWW